MSAGEGANSKENYSYMPVDAALLNGKKRCADPGARCALLHVPAPHVHAALARQVGPPTSAPHAVAVADSVLPCTLCRLPIIPIAAGTGGILFPECQQNIMVSGEELSVVRSIEAEQVPLFGYCTVSTDGDLLPVGTMALLEKVEWSQLTPEEGGPPEKEGMPWTPWGSSNEDSKALLRCVGVQRFRVLGVETRDPFPIAHVELFTDEPTEHQQPQLDGVLSEVESAATEKLSEVLRIGRELIGDVVKSEIEDAQDRMSKFAPGGHGTQQIVMSPLGPMGWKLGERERRELQSFSLADLQNANESARYEILECRSTILRFQRVAEMLEPELNKLVAQNALKKLSVDDTDSK